MAYFDFIWTSHNIEHIAEHGITADEAQDVVSFPMEEGTSRVSGRYTALGFTATGKYIKVVYEKIDPITVYVITAYDK